jgi:hypothetical protein
VTLFRMARQTGNGLGLISAFPDLVSVEWTALGHALEWAAAPGQTPEWLHAALVAYRDENAPCYGHGASRGQPRREYA